MVRSKNNFFILLSVFFIALFALSFAFISEYAFGLYPCILCIYQRIPYAIVLGVSVLALFFYKKPKIVKLVLLVCAVGFFADAAIAFFHVGVEYKWWEGTDKCSGQVADSIESLKAALVAAPSVRCDDPQFQFILTMAGWNVLYALVATAYSVFKLKLIMK